MLDAALLVTVLAAAGFSEVLSSAAPQPTNNATQTVSTLTRANRNDLVLCNTTPSIFSFPRIGVYLWRLPRHSHYCYPSVDMIWMQACLMAAINRLWTAVVFGF